MFTICPDRCSFDVPPKLTIRTSGEVPDIQTVFQPESVSNWETRIATSGSGREGQCTSGITARYPSIIRQVAVGRLLRSTENAFYPPTRLSCRSRTVVRPASASVNTERSTTAVRISNPNLYPNGQAYGIWQPGCWARDGAPTSPDSGGSSGP